MIADQIYLNDQLTLNTSDSLFQGLLRDYLIDADLIINSYAFDPTQPITREHQSDFRAPVGPTTQSFGENKLLYQSDRHVGHSRNQQENLLLGITVLDEQDNPQKNPPPKVEQVLSPGWNNFSTTMQDNKLKRFGAWLSTHIIHSPLSILDIFVTGFTGKPYIADLMHKVEDDINEYFSIPEDNLNQFQYYASFIGSNNTYISTLIGKVINNILKECTAFIVQAPKLIYKKIKRQLKLLGSDFKNGCWGKIFKKDPVPSQREDGDSQTMSKTQFDTLQGLVTKAKVLNQIQHAHIYQNVQYAMPIQPLEPYEPNDIISFAVSGITGFTNFFKDQVFEKRPFIGLICAIAYAFGGCAVIAPAALKLILTKIGLTASQVSETIKLLQDIGAPLANGEIGHAIASGFTLAKAVGLTLDTATQGCDSALFELINNIRKNPLLYLAGIGVAYGFGHLVTDVVEIPLVSEYFRDEIGTAPVLSKIMIGAKLGLVSIETAIPEDEAHKSILAEFVSSLTKTFMVLLRAGLSIFSLSKEPWTALYQQAVEFGAIIAHAANRLAVTASQLLVQVPKNLLEVATTCYSTLAKIIHYPFSWLYQSGKATPTVSTVLQLKRACLNKGYWFNSFFRDNLSRPLERAYTKAVHEINQERNAKTDYATILQQLMPGEAAFYPQQAKNINEKPTPPIHPKPPSPKPQKTCSLRNNRTATTNMQTTNRPRCSSLNI